LITKKGNNSKLNIGKYQQCDVDTESIIGTIQLISTLHK